MVVSEGVGDVVVSEGVGDVVVSEGVGDVVADAGAEPGRSLSFTDPRSARLR